MWAIDQPCKISKKNFTKKTELDKLHMYSRNTTCTIWHQNGIGEVNILRNRWTDIPIDTVTPHLDFCRGAGINTICNRNMMCQSQITRKLYKRSRITDGYQITVHGDEKM